MELILLASFSCFSFLLSSLKKTTAASAAVVFSYSFSSLRRAMLMAPSCMWLSHSRLLPQP